MSTCTIADDQGVPRTGYLHVVEGHILHQGRRIQALNEAGADQVMKGQADERADRGTVEGRVVEAIEQMRGAWPCSPNANAELAGELA
jgi:hypothetical protein